MYKLPLCPKPWPIHRALFSPRPYAFSTTSPRPDTSNAAPAAATSLSPKPPLPGTVPAHSSYILLHAASPPPSFPARASSPLQRALQLTALQWGGVVNFAWFGPSAHRHTTPDRAAVTAFSAKGGRLEIPELTLENVGEVGERLRLHAVGEGGPGVGTQEEEDEEVHLYVCTHGARDCRCGDVGGAVVRALREEVARRVEADPGGRASRVRVGEVGHVGGHQYAANLLVYPHGDWLGLLTPEDVPSVLTSILDYPIRPFGAGDRPIVPRHWRGRMDLSKDEQLQLFESRSAP